MRGADIGCVEPFVFDDPKIYAEHSYVEQLQESLAKHEAIPIAVGSGTINDVTKLAAHRTSRPYMAVATAASMDGYTAFGASITHQGWKQTFDCPAPAAVVADLEIIAAAPAEMNAWGYADLLAKMTAGADWIVADVLGVEPIDPVAWEMVQRHLREWVAQPGKIASGDVAAIGNLVRGLMMSGFAMQRTCTSRPASGAEHQFSHLWDMEHLKVEGPSGSPQSPSHGAKVGIGTLAVARLYDALPEEIPHHLQTESVHIDALFDSPELRELAHRETAAKKRPGISLEQWEKIREKVTKHLLPAEQMRQMLVAAGAVTEAEQIGVSRGRLRESYRRAYHIRRRYTVLDLAVEAGVLEECLERIFCGR